MASPSVTALVLSWNGLPATLRCVSSIASSTIPVDVLVIDNASGDGSAGALARSLGEDRVLALPENRGYAGGMNAGLARVLATGGPEFLLLLTQDVVLEPGAIEEMVAAAERDSAAGAVGPVVHLDTPGLPVFSAGGRLDARWAIASHEAGPRQPVPYPVEWLDGCCMLLRRAALEDVGRFDERYFMYYEENDLCQRLRRHGWTLLVAPAARLTQTKADVRGQHYFYYISRNRFIFWRENFGVGTARVLGSLGRDLFWDAARIGRAILRRRYRPELRTAVVELGRRIRGTMMGASDSVRSRYGYRPFGARRDA